MTDNHEKELLDKAGLIAFLRQEELPDVRTRIENLAHNYPGVRIDTTFLPTVVERIIKDINAYPSVSAVVPVRCRDCVHHRKADGYCWVWKVAIRDDSYYCGDGTKENTDDETRNSRLTTEPKMED